MRTLRKVVCYTVLINAFVNVGCVRIPESPAETPSNYEYVAPIELNTTSRFARFDLSPTAEAWTGIKLGYGNLSVFDADNKLMRCGDFSDSQSSAMSNRDERSSVGVVRVDNPASPCTSGEPVRCVRNQERGETLYELHFNSPIDAPRIRSQRLALVWNHAPNAFGFVHLLDDVGRITTQDRLGASTLDSDGRAAQEIRVAVNFHKPALQLLVRSPDPTLVLTSADLIEHVPRGDRFDYWFEASGRAPYRLLFDWKHGTCHAGSVARDQLPPEAALDGWPPFATIGASHLNPRGFLERFRGNLNPGWWFLLEIFIPVWLTGMILALLFRLLVRREA